MRRAVVLTPTSDWISLASSSEISASSRRRPSSIERSPATKVSRVRASPFLTLEMTEEKNAMGQSRFRSEFCQIEVESEPGRSPLFALCSAG